MQPGNVSPDEPVKPAGVPQGAYWDESDNEWVLPERNAAGVFHGLVKWYRPDGTLCCATDHVDGKPHGKFTRYHENGEPSRIGTFVRGTLHGLNVFTRSTAKTTENFPNGLGKHIWRCEMDFADGRMTEGRLFDREGRRVMEDGTPFPTERPKGVAAAAHFRKPEGHEDYRWVHGETKQVGDDWHRIGTWRYWTDTGVLVREEPYEGGELHGVVREYSDDDGTLLDEQRYEHGVRHFDRPRGVPDDAQFDSDDEVWQHRAGANGDARTWDARGVLRMSETYADGQLVRVREFLSDGSLAQDSTVIDGGVPRRKWFRRTGEEELESFPNVDPEDAREVEYLFDEHGRMLSFRITDEAGAELEREDVYRNAEGSEEQARFASIDEAAQAWTTEGERYTALLNKWLGELYSDEEPSFEEPTFDRADLERGVIDAVTEMNARGDGALAHAKFPLYYDGISSAFWDRYGLVVDRVMVAGGETYARVLYQTKDPEVFKLGTTIEVVPGVVGFGASYDKQYVAFAYDDRIEIRHGGERITLAYPTATTGSELGIQALRVFPNGREVLLVSAQGIYVVGGESQRLYPLDATLAEYGDDKLEMSFANGDLSPAGDRVTCGGMFRRGVFAELAMYRKVDGKWVLENTSQDNAFFPAQAVFHRSRPHVAFAATLYASLSNALTNTTFRIDLDDLQPGVIDSFGGGIAQERGRVSVIASFGKGFLLGFDNGYIRWMGVDDNAELLGYVYVGGNILDIDVAPDQQSFAVASDAGLVSRFSLADTASTNLVTTMPLRDDSRTAFFRTWPPLRW